MLRVLQSPQRSCEYPVFVIYRVECGFVVLLGCCGIKVQFGACAEVQICEIVGFRHQVDRHCAPQGSYAA